MTIFRKGLLVLVLAWGISGCEPEHNDKLTIAAAANMQFAMEALIEAFTAETGIHCETAISSSGKLTAQIEEGAPFDLFISADMKYPTRLYENGRSLDAPEVYAYGQLVLWTVVDDLEPSIQVLSEERIRHVAMANPKTAPYGVAAKQVLDHYQLSERLREKLVYGESISQTNQFVISKAAEIGFTAKSVILSPQMEGRGQWQDVDPSIYSPIAQGVVILKKPGQDREAAYKFYQFLFSGQARAILKEFGYQVIN